MLTSWARKRCYFFYCRLSIVNYIGFMWMAVSLIVLGSSKSDEDRGLTLFIYLFVYIYPFNWTVKEYVYIYLFFFLAKFRFGGISRTTRRNRKYFLRVFALRSQFGAITSDLIQRENGLKFFLQYFFQPHLKGKWEDIFANELNL